MRLLSRSLPLAMAGSVRLASARRGILGASLALLVLVPRPAAAAEDAAATHTVVRGETLWRIARGAGLDVATLARLNDLDPSGQGLRIGRVLKLRADAPLSTAPSPEPPAPPPLPANGPPDRSTATHVVQRGETLWRIARHYGTSVEALERLNGLENGARLRSGLRLTLRGEAGGAAPGGSTPAPPGSPAPPAAPVPAPAPPPAGRQVAGLAEIARRQVGRPYAWGGADPSGFDCSGLVWYVARAAGLSVPRSLEGQFGSGTSVAREDLRPGDLVFFRNTYKPGLSHNGVYVGDGQFVHAVDETRGVLATRLAGAYWASRYVGARRLS